MATKEFVEADLRGARFERSDLSGAVMRGVDVMGLDIDTPHLHEGALIVNGIDVAPHVEGELNRRFPGRELRRAEDADGLRASWTAVEAAWADAVARAEGHQDVSVDGEWTFAQTLRHLVMATNIWLDGAVLGRPQPIHPIGQPIPEWVPEGGDPSLLAEPSSYAEVLTVRAEHQARVRDHLAGLSADDLTVPRVHPWAPERRIPALRCFQVILNEEWEHLRFAARDLATLTG